MVSTARLKWNKDMLGIVNWVNSFYEVYFSALEGSSRQFFPFFVDDQRVGVVPKFFVETLKRFPSTFIVDNAVETTSSSRQNKASVSLHPDLKTVAERSDRVDAVLREIRDGGQAGGAAKCLAGWRDEHYVVSAKYAKPTLMTMERAAAPLFGIKAYGVHVNGFVRSPSRPENASEDSPSGLYMWIGRRSKTKQTFPGKLDHVAAGGLTAGMPIQDVLVRECMEEASIPEEWTKKSAVAVGSISYCYQSGKGEDETGVKPEMEFCFDLPLPLNFVPINTDGETECFYLWPIEKVQAELTKGDFKPNVAIVILDFLIRHGFLHPDLDPNYTDFLEGIHKTI